MKRTARCLGGRSGLAFCDRSWARIIVASAAQPSNGDHRGVLKEYSCRSTHVASVDSPYEPCRHPCAPLLSVFAVCQSVSGLERLVLTWLSATGGSAREERSDDDEQRSFSCSTQRQAIAHRRPRARGRAGLPGDSLIGPSQIREGHGGARTSGEPTEGSRSRRGKCPVERRSEPDPGRGRLSDRSVGALRRRSPLEYSSTGAVHLVHHRFER